MSYVFRFPNSACLIDAATSLKVVGDFMLIVSRSGTVTVSDQFRSAGLRL